MEKQTVVMVTGGTGGIGWHLSEGYLKNGCKVYSVDHKCHKPLNAAIEFIEADLSDKVQIDRVFEQIVMQEGHVDVLINNAAIASYTKPLSDVEETDYYKVMDINLKGALFCCKAFVKANQGAEYGRIINIASTRWHQNEANHDLYGISKGGMVSMTQSLCVSLSGTDITVNTVSPGWIETGDYEALSETDHKQHPSGRVGKPEDILRACLFLSDKFNDFVNGVNLVVDGGMTKRMIYF